MRFFVGSDVGGTFTDLWVATSEGEARVFKSPTTADVQTGVLDAVALAADSFGMSVEAFCDSIERFGHGTTVGLNALLTGRASPTAILCTQGFGDTLEIGRLTRQSTGLNEHEYTDSYLRNRFPPIVPRTRIHEIAERIDARGNVVTVLDEVRARAIVQNMARSNVTSVAICLLFATINPAHEIALLRIVREEMPNAYISVSHEVSPNVGEYARMSTTAANAALGPVAGGYLKLLEGKLQKLGLRVPILMMTCGGGVLPTRALNDRPVFALFSGPAGCVKASQAIGEIAGLPNVLSTDIGGTSFDVGVIVDGAPLMRSELSIAGADLRVHSIDVQSIGAGGGSIAWLDADGALRVGPQSAGATPGPACYGRGGIEPTATDADLVLGVLDPDNFIGGSLKLDVAAARAAIARVAKPLGLDIETAAWGIRRILDSRMADLLRRVTIERGYDPKNFALLANGGAGPSHAWALADELGLDRFIVPAAATALSALGTAVADFQFSSERAAYIRVQGARTITEAEVHTLDAALHEVASDVHTQLATLAKGEIAMIRTASIRFLGQTHYVDTVIPAGSLDVATMSAVLDAFRQQYARRFGSAAIATHAGYEILSIRAAGTVSLPPPALASKGAAPVREGMRRVWFGHANAPVECAVWSAVVPPEGWETTGPAVIEFKGQTVLIPPGGSARADRIGNLHVRLAR